MSIGPEVRRGLTRTPKQLPPSLFYDEEGSRLFEAITALPEYYLTRTEHAILVARVQELLHAVQTPLTLIELGAGSAAKTRVLIEALLMHQGRANYHPIDVSETALAQARTRLEGDFPGLTVSPIVASYRPGLEQVRELAGPKLVLFIGSSIGNFDPPQARALLSEMRRAMEPGDHLLLGLDLVKCPTLLLPAYDDAAGVTARFNLNALRRINRELHGHFPLERFHHVALWNEAHSRMEMHLESTVAQQVRVDDLELVVDFAQGERIHTESSYKFTREMIDAILAGTGLLRQLSWQDARGWFGLELATAV